MYFNTFQYVLVCFMLQVFIRFTSRLLIGCLSRHHIDMEGYIFGNNAAAKPSRHSYKEEMRGKQCSLAAAF